MKIDRNNYEIYFLDYLEGRLTTEETAALLLFADKNPDLKELIEGEELISLVPDEKISFFPKAALKKTADAGEETGAQKNPLNNAPDIKTGAGLDSGNYEEFMIRYYENDLSEAEKVVLSDFLKDSPTCIKEFEIFGNTLLKPDMGIAFPYKSSLKRRSLFAPGYKRFIAIVSVAASVLLFSTVFLKLIVQPVPKEVDKVFAQSVENNAKPKESLLINDNSANTEQSEIKTSKDIELNAHATIGKTHSSEKATVISNRNNSSSKFLISYAGNRTPFRKNHAGNRTPFGISHAEDRTPFEAVESVKLNQPLQLALTSLNIPQAIERRTDFDGITSVAYYDPDPDALPLKSEGKTIGGRLGYSLAQGISQTAGTITREPELNRLLHGKFSLSDIANLGIAGYNLITDSKISISRDYDAKGNMKGHSLKDGEKRLTRLP